MQLPNIPQLAKRDQATRKSAAVPFVDARKMGMGTSLTNPGASDPNGRIDHGVAVATKNDVNAAARGRKVDIFGVANMGESE